MNKCIACFLVALALAYATTASAGSRPGSKRAWVASVAVLVAANIVDTHSSWGGMEANPLLGRGRFGPRAAAVKGGATAGIVAVEYLLIRRRPAWSPGFAAGNIGAAGLIGVMAARNYRYGAKS